MFCMPKLQTHKQIFCDSIFFIFMSQTLTVDFSGLHKNKNSAFPLIFN